jgi:hypothetical protein
VVVGTRSPLRPKAVRELIAGGAEISAGVRPGAGGPLVLDHADIAVFVAHAPRDAPTPRSSPRADRMARPQHGGG